MTAKIALVEVFASPQGEGYHAGRRAVFVRLAGCPLACEFAPGVVCDTPYMQANMKVTLAELFQEVIPSLATLDTTEALDERIMLIFTGGEPTAAPLFDSLVRQAFHAGFYVAVETNGTTWRNGLQLVHWMSVSPKEDIAQTSLAIWHNKNPRSPKLNEEVKHELWRRAPLADRLPTMGGEYRYVIAGGDVRPPYYSATRHYVSPAVLSDGSGEEWKKGFPGFAPGAVESCLAIIRQDPRWRISLQNHKFLGVR